MEITLSQHRELEEELRKHYKSGDNSRVSGMEFVLTTLDIKLDWDSVYVRDDEDDD